MTDTDWRSVPALPWAPVLAVVALIALWRLGAAWLLPVTQDEAYYFDWARSLAWGYFDHPPGVAVLGAGTLLGPASALWARLGTVLASSLTLLVLARLYWRAGLRSREDLLLALVIAFAAFSGIAAGLITTPDTVLALFWALALHEALAALSGDRRRWVTAGVAVGAGLLGKYTMVLIGPVLLWAILRRDPRALRTPWPWLGALAVVLVFSPHILWNAQNDWLTMRFQFGHGFSLETGELLANPLPPPADAWTPRAAAATAPDPGERAGEVLAFLGTQAGLWGLILLPLAAAPFARARRRPLRRDELTGLLPEARSLLAAAALFPLGFFALVSSFSEVEPNWPAMYLMGAVPFAVILLRPLWRWALAAAAGNIVLASLYAFHAATAALPLPDSQNRVLRETHGFRELAALAAALPGPVFADRYQTVAALRFYQPELAATQWPGITRPSEYLRGRIAPPVTLDDIRRAGGFHLVSTRETPPGIPGFRADTGRILYDCIGLPLTEAPPGEPPCAKPLHRWGVFGYRPD